MAKKTYTREFNLKVVCVSSVAAGGHVHSDLAAYRAGLGEAQTRYGRSRSSISRSTQMP
jgi:hypothetical protein